MKETTQRYLTLLLVKHPELRSIENTITSAFELIQETFHNDGKLLVCGNGGSAADADHIVGELMKGFLKNRTISREVREKINQMDSSGKISSQLQGALCAINLSAHASLTTAIANDKAPDMVFAQQVAGYGRESDVLLGISTSGNSVNVINAGIVARAIKMKTIGLTGMDGGRMNDFFDIVIKVPEHSTASIQELHLPIYHALCAMLEEEIFGEEQRG